MATLTSCMKKAGAALRDEDRADILARFNALVGEGAKAGDAAKQAVAEQIAKVQGLLGEPVAAAEPVAEKPAKQPAAKIGDFGEKLEGARKDYATTLKDAEDVDVSAEPLSKSWPEPDYQKLLDGGADPFVVAFIHAARDEVPTKPQKPWKLKGWVDSVQTLRGAARGLLDGSISREQLDSKLTLRAFDNVRRNVGSRAELYQLVGHDKSLKGITFAEHQYSLYKGQSNVRKWVVEQKAKATMFSNWPRELAVADTKAEMLEQFRARFAEPDATGKNAPAKGKFSVYTKRKQEGVFIGKKIGREYIDLKKLPDIASARKFLDEQTAELETLLEKYKETPFERNPENQPRVGDDHRNGAPVTPKIFEDTFGFRGVQFGNYVEQARRQSDLNQSFDSLMDLAAVLGVPPRALSLNGRLGLAFGARGKGGTNAPAAHYESGKVVINLTKNAGPGSLAHEWWHAVDNYFGKNDGGASYGTGGTLTDKTRAAMRLAFNEVKAATQQGTLRRRAMELDKRKSKAYWDTPIELSARSFESYVIAKLKDQGAANDYLANVVSKEFWDAQEAMRAGFLAEGKPAETYPYPTPDEVPAVRNAFDNFFRVVETRADDAGNVALFSRAPGTQVELEAADAVGREFWRKIDNGELFTSKEVLDALAINRRGTVRETPDVALPESSAGVGQSVVRWSGEVAGFDGYRTSAAWDGDSFTVYVVPEELAAGVDLTEPEQARPRALVSYAFTPTGGGRYAFSVNDTAPNGPADAVLRERDAIKNTGTDDKPYTRVEVGARMSGVLIQEAARRLALNIGSTPAVYYPQRDTGARAGKTETARDYPADTLRKRFSQTGQPAGIPLADAEAVADAIRAAYPTGPQIVVVDDVRKAPESLLDQIKNAQAMNSVEGAYYKGKIYLFPQNVADINRLMFVGAHHEIRHAGLDALFGKRKGALLLSIAMSNPKVAEAARKKMADGLADSMVAATEEALADMPLEDMAKLNGWNKIVAAVRQWLRGMADRLRRNHPKLAAMIQPDQWTDNDIAALIQRAEDISRGGTVPARAAGAVFSQSQDKPLTEAKFYSRYLMHKDIRGTRSGTAAQTAEAIMRDGFQSQGPGAVNVMPAYRGGEPRYVSDQAYGPRAGDTVYLVPREAVKGDKVVAGWKPKPYEVLAITEDYPALYPLYVEAFNADKARGGMPLFSRADQTQTPARPEAARAVDTGKRSPLTGKPLIDVLDAAGNRIETSHIAATTDEALDNYRQRPARQAAARAAAPAPTYAMPEKAAKAEGSNWRRVRGQEFTSLDEDDGYLYHVTSAPAASGVREQGLVPNAGGMFGGFYANYSAGKVFLTERSGVSYWQEKVGQQLEAAMDNPPAVTVLRIPKDKIKAKLQPDTVGSGDAGAPAFYSEQAVFSRAGTAKVTAQDLLKANGGVFGRAGETKQDRVRAVVDGSRPFWLGALTRDQIADMYGDELPPVRDYDNLTRAMENERQGAAQKADELYEEWSKIDAEANDRLARLMLDATVAQVHPDRATLPAKATDEQKQAHARMRVQFNLLPKDAQAMYGKVRDFHANTLKDLRAALEGRISRLIENGSERAVALAEIRARFDQYMQGGPYFPLHRFGDFLVVAERAKDGERVVAAYENAGEQQAAARALEADGFAVKLTMAKAYTRSMDGSAGKFIGDVLTAIDKMDLREANINGTPTSMKAQLLDDLNQLFIKALPDLSYRKHFTHRKGTAGFSADVMRGFASSAFHAAGHIARLNHGDKMTFALDDAYQQIKLAPAGDFTKAGQVLNEMALRHEAALNPNVSPLSALATQVGFVMYLGLSPAAGLINMMQVPMVALPYIGARYGFAKATAAMGRAYTDIMGAKPNAKNGFNAAQSPKLSADERRAISTLQDEGVIDLTQAHDLAAATTRDVGNQARNKASFAIARAMRIVGWTFHVPEVMNRQVTALMAYRLEMAKSGNEGKAMDAAREAIKRSQFDYASSNRARYMQGDIARVVTQFRQFSQNMTYFLGRAAFQALKGEDPEVRRIARQQLVATFLVTGAMAGSLGLPGLGFFAGLVEALVNAMGDDDDEPWDWKTAYRNMLADNFGKEWGEVMARGVPRALMPAWDISNRVSLGDLWWRDNSREGDSPREAFANDMSNILGPTAGTLLGWYTASDHMARGDYAKAVESVVPKFIRDPLKAWRESQDGITSYNGEPLLELTGPEVAGRFLGFAPSRASEMFEGRNAVMTAKTALDDRRQRLISQMAKARIDGDTEAVAELQQRIRDWNTENPKMAITGATIVRSVLNRRRNTANTEQGITLPDSKDFLRDRARFAEVD